MSTILSFRLTSAVANASLAVDTVSEDWVSSCKSSSSAALSPLVGSAVRKSCSLDIVVEAKRPNCVKEGTQLTNDEVEFNLG